MQIFYMDTSLKNKLKSTSQISGKTLTSRKYVKIVEIVQK